MSMTVFPTPASDEAAWATASAAISSGKALGNGGKISFKILKNKKRNEM